MFLLTVFFLIFLITLAFADFKMGLMMNLEFSKIYVDTLLNNKKNTGELKIQLV